MLRQLFVAITQILHANRKILPEIAEVKKKILFFLTIFPLNG